MGKLVPIIVVMVILVDDIAQSSDNVPSSSISYTYILYIPVGISYVHPITVLVHTKKRRPI